MIALLFLFLIVGCNGNRAKIYRDGHEQKFIQPVRYEMQHKRHTTTSSENSLKAKPRVFRNVQVPLDDDANLYRASGRFQRKSVTSAPPLHNVTKFYKDSSHESINYEEGKHHLNKLTEDKKVMEEADQFAKGIERTTVAVRKDREETVTTPLPVISSRSIPAIITPRVLMTDKKHNSKQAPSNFFQPSGDGSPTPNVFAATSNTLNYPYQQPMPGQVTPSTIPFTVQTPYSQPILQVLAPGQLVSQIQPGISPASGTISMSKLPNQTLQSNNNIGLSNGVQFPYNQYPPISQITDVPLSPPLPQIPARHFSQPVQTPTLQSQQSPPGYMQTPQIINGQAANSSLEQLGCGFDWLTNSCKDVFVIGWCGQCHDFGNIFMHDCKCVRPLITLPPRQTVQPNSFHTTI